MDNLTHSLFALTLANAGLRRVGRGTTAALLVGSNIPDIEILTTFTGGRVAYLAAHRGPTHGPATLLLGAGVAAAVWAAQRLRGREAGDATFLGLLVAASVGVVGHVLMDFATSYGTRILSPFDQAWYGVDWLPIIDVFLLALLVIGLIIGRLRPEWRVRAAAVVLALLVVDYGARSWLHSQAMGRAAALDAPVAGQEADAGRARTVFRYLDHSDPSRLPAALPTEGSPFDWRVVVRQRGGYLVTDVRLLDRDAGWEERAVRRGIWFPNDAGPFIDRAAATRIGRVFLTFSRFPSAEIVRHANGDLTVHWYDLRFAQRRAPVGRDRREHSSPFGAWVRMSPRGDILGQGLGPG